MNDIADIDFTLPSVVADLEGKYRQIRLMLTIAFHPDTSRIGQRALLSVDPEGQQWELGRNFPEFYTPTGLRQRSSDIALLDPHISRKTLRLGYRDKSLMVVRESRTCRCQINGRELDDEAILSAANLRAGATIFLAHRVLLMVREVCCDEEAERDVVFSSSLKGSSVYMSQLRKQIEAIAASDCDVLIRGETGTGKELVASAIHANSPMAKREMVTVNMSAIPPALAPAALFGSAKGAYTGADAVAVGYFEQARGGVLFLDEVGDTPPEIQAQLLRALQQREIQPVGGRVHTVEVRVIAATDAPLHKTSDFRAALLYRLGDCEIVLQPLRQHPEDIGELLLQFLQDSFERTGRSLSFPGPESDPLDIAAWAELFHAFLRFPWPGNVRQLHNFARQVALSSDTALVLPESIVKQLNAGKDPGLSRSAALRRSENVGEEEFLQAMAEARYEPKAAARILNMSRTAVYRRMAEFSQLRIASQVPEQELCDALSACGGDLNRAAFALKVSRCALRTHIRQSAKSGQ